MGNMKERKIEQAVILAGGLGTRLRPFTDANPKPMYPINGVPFLDHLFEQIASFGIRKVLLLLGYKGNVIVEHIQKGNKYNLIIDYEITPVEYDTGDRLVAAMDKIEDTFLLLYCDNYCPINYKRLINDFVKNNANVQISAYINSDGYTKNNLKIDNDGRVLVYDKTRKKEDLKGVDIGYALINKSVLHDYKEKKYEIRNFETCMYPKLVVEGKMFATITEHRYYSIGSWERIKLTENFFNNKKTIFLDRDGTINVKAPKACYIEKEEDFVWIPKAKEAIGLLKNKGYRVIVITNQPGIARGKLTINSLNEIHEKMQRELFELTGFTIDDFFYCPHDWNEGCECRKPKPGLFYMAQKKYSLNLTECIMIGDDDRDIIAGQSAGCRCVQVNDKYRLYNAIQEIMEKENERGK